MPHPATNCQLDANPGTTDAGILCRRNAKKMNTKFNSAQLSAKA